MKHEKWLKREKTRREKEAIALFKMKKRCEEIKKARKDAYERGETSFGYSLSW